MKQLHDVGTQHGDKDCQTSKFVEKEMKRIIRVKGKICSGILNANCQKQIGSRSIQAMDGCIYTIHENNAIKLNFTDLKM